MDAHLFFSLLSLLLAEPSMANWSHASSAWYIVGWWTPRHRLRSAPTAGTVYHDMLTQKTLATDLSIHSDGCLAHLALDITYVTAGQKWALRASLNDPNFSLRNLLWSCGEKETYGFAWKLRGHPKHVAVDHHISHWLIRAVWRQLHFFLDYPTRPQAKCHQASCGIPWPLSGHCWRYPIPAQLITLRHSY